MLMKNLQLLQGAIIVHEVFLIIMGTYPTIRGQYWMKTVIVDMTIMLKMLMLMALQRNNKDEFV